MILALILNGRMVLSSVLLLLSSEKRRKKTPGSTSNMCDYRPPIINNRVGWHFVSKWKLFPWLSSSFRHAFKLNKLSVFVCHLQILIICKLILTGIFANLNVCIECIIC